MCHHVTNKKQWQNSARKYITNTEIRLYFKNTLGLIIFDITYSQPSMRLVHQNQAHHALSQYIRKLNVPETYYPPLIPAPIRKILFVIINLSDGVDNVCGWNFVTSICSLVGHSMYMQGTFFRYLKFLYRILNNQNKRN